MPFDFPSPFEHPSASPTQKARNLPKLAGQILGSAGTEVGDLLQLDEEIVDDDVIPGNEPLFSMGERLEDVHTREQQRLSAFFGQEILVDPLPPEITPEQIGDWREKGFELHFLPEMTLRNADGTWKELASWTHKPTIPQGYDLLMSPKAFGLRKGWVLWDERAPTFDGQELNHKYDDDPFSSTIAALRESGDLNQDKRFGHNPNQYPYEQTAPKVTDLGTRFSLPAGQLSKPEIRERFADVLGVRPEAIRFPYFLEANILQHVHGLRTVRGLTEYYEDEVTDKQYGDMVVNGYANNLVGVGTRVIFDPSLGFRFVAQISK